MQNVDIDLLLKVCRLLAIGVLENGGETYRAEDAVLSVCSAYGMPDSQVLALPTGIFVSISADGAVHKTFVARINTRSIDLTKVDEVNRISRDLAQNIIPLEHALNLLTASEEKKWGRFIAAFCSALSAAFFSLLFGGEVFEFIISFIGTLIVQLVCLSLRKEGMYLFVSSFIGGTVSALFAMIACAIAGGSLDTVISACIMPLVPGLMMVNAIRDSMRGDLVSGVGRVCEAGVAALAIAAGVSMALMLLGRFMGL